jgi:hypothetical protein
MQQLFVPNPTEQHLRVVHLHLLARHQETEIVFLTAGLSPPKLRT